MPVEKIQISLISDKNIHEDQHIFLIIRRSSILKIRKFSDIFVGKIKTRTSCSIIFFSSSSSFENLAFVK